MQRVVNFSLPPNFTPEERHYFGRQLIGSAFVVKKNPTEVVCVFKDYVIKVNDILFTLEVLDERVDQLLDSGEYDPNYFWFDPVASFLSPLM